MAFQEAVKATLTKIGLTDFDVLVYSPLDDVSLPYQYFHTRPYIEGIVSDETSSREEKLESLNEFLSMAKVFLVRVVSLVSHYDV